MSKPNQTTRNLDKYKRQLKILEIYLVGRMKQLATIGKNSPGEVSACEMAHSELNILLTQVLPQMQEVQS